MRLRLLARTRVSHAAQIITAGAVVPSARRKIIRMQANATINGARIVEGVVPVVVVPVRLRAEVGGRARGL
jgi:hypothetical protein